jgi:hypothetical protein
MTKVAGLGDRRRCRGTRQIFFNKRFLEEAMKKKVKKLELNKETVRNLTADDLRKIAGGSSEGCTRPITICNSCHSFCDPTCP